MLALMSTLRCLITLVVLFSYLSELSAVGFKFRKQPERTVSINKKASSTIVLDDFRTVFDAELQPKNKSDTNTGVCNGAPTKREWLLSFNESIDAKPIKILYQNDTVFLLNTQKFSIDVRSLVFDDNKISTVPLGRITSDLSNTEDHDNVHFLMQGEKSLLLILTQNQIISYDWSYYPSSPTNLNKVSYQKIKQTNEVIGYQKVELLLNAYISDNYLFVCGSSKGLFIYSFLPSTTSNQQTVNLERKISSLDLGLPKSSSINITDVAFAPGGLIYIMDSYHGIFIARMDKSNIQKGIKIEQKIDILDGSAIKYSNGAMIALTSNSSGSFLSEYFRSYDMREIKEHYLNRQTKLNSKADQLWIDQEHAYLTIGGSSYAYQLGIPNDENTNISAKGYLKILTSFALNSALIVNNNDYKWLLAIGNGALYGYEVKLIPAAIVCDLRADIEQSMLSYRLKTYQSDCHKSFNSEISKPNSTFCIYEQDFSILINERTPDEGDTSFMLRLAFGLCIFSAMLVAAYYLLRKYKDQVPFLMRFSENDNKQSHLSQEEDDDINQQNNESHIIITDDYDKNNNQKSQKLNLEMEDQTL